MFLARYALRPDYLLFVGAGDARKNVLGLLQAYAMLPKTMRMKHQLVIVGADVARLHEAATSLGIEPRELAPLRYMPEEDLPALYSMCRAFVMPSKHEGFGLPALEAMACGVPVIASNTTSLPEVVGANDALFDPYDPASIADRLQLVLKDDEFRSRLARDGLARAAEFTWEESARRAWIALEAMEERGAWRSRRASNVLLRRKPRLAYVAPLPSVFTAASGDARDLLPELTRFYDITLVTGTALTDGDNDTLRSVFPTMSESRFASAASSFDRIIYEVGNSEPYGSILEYLLPRHPGVVILREACLCDIPLAGFLRTGERDGKHWLGRCSTAMAGRQ